MRKNLLFVLVTVLLAMSNTMFAQQLPNAGFEEWDGVKFDGKIQLTSWNAANVEQTYLGITARGNMIYRETDAHSGTYCAHVKNTKVEVAGIGEVSPSWITLGTPFTDITNGIQGATAGTYGGVNWTYRPDTLQVWLKHTLGGSNNEIFSIVYYSWKGTSKGNSYKAKNGNCVTIKEKIDEESDIRQVTDGNVCGTNVNAVQVAEGWHKEMTVYSEWTLFKVPINYYTNDVPEKMNIILAGGRYPDFRANTGIYEGNGIYIDDISLIYSSKAHEMYIGGRKFGSFEQNTYSYTYVLGNGVTTIPAISLKRSGRTLSPSEYTIVNGAVDGAPTTITIRAEDNSSTTTYSVSFVSQQSDNARLSDIRVNGTSISGFNAFLTNYNVALPFGTTAAPVVSADAQDANANVTITQPASPSGKATILVTAQDGVHTQTYTINFSVAQLSDNTLQDILVDGSSLPGFVPSKLNYSVSLPLGTTTAPTITPVSAYPAGAQTITVLKNSLTDGCQIQVSAPGASSPRTYKLTYVIEASKYSYLSDIKLDGVSLADFAPTTTSYTYQLPLGTTVLPTISWTQGDPYQSVVLTEGGLEGTTRIVVTAAAGNTTTYRLSFSTEKSSNAHLSSIALDGVELADFNAETLTYTINLPAGTKTMPTITWTAGDAYQSVRLVTAGLSNPARIIVTAGDGSTLTYLLNFAVEKSVSAFLQNILLDGVTLAGFQSDKFDYTYHLESATSPRISVVKGEGQSVTISQPRGAGIAMITVQPEDGEPNVYTITFVGDNEVVIPEPVAPSYTPSANADIAMIYVGGDSLAGFDPAVLEYTVMLPYGTSVQPVLTAKTADEKVAYVIYTQGEPNADAWIRVVAEDSVTTKDYLIHFPMALSSNTQLEDIDAGGYLTFSPSQTTYSFDLPFGTPFPELFITKAEECQKVETSYLDCKTRRDVDIVVTAEDGTQATYAVHMTISTHPDNVLKSVMGDGWMLDSLALNNGSDTVIISLPYEAESFAISSIIKNYDDQFVVIRDGGLTMGTTLWVYSGYPGEPVKTYILLPKQENPYLLTDLTVNGTTIAGFSPKRFDYILSIEDTIPTIATTITADATLDTLFNDAKHYQVAVYGDTVVYTYTVWYFYPNDTIPNADFSQSDVAKYNNGFKPKYWQVPADAANSHSFIFATTTRTGNEATRNTDGSVRLATTRTAAASAIYGSVPGFMTIGTLNMKFASAGGSSSSATGGIVYRNTPDTLLVDAQPVSNRVFTGTGATDMSNWRVLAVMGGQRSLYEGDFSELNEWQTVRLPLKHGEVIDTLNIVLNSGSSENAGDYGGTSCYTSQVDFRDVRIAYSSKMNGIVYNGDTIYTDSVGGHFEIDLPTEYMGVPDLHFLHAVSDQSTEVLWPEEVAGVRNATIRNYAEDGSYTDYALTVTRPLSTDAGFTIITTASPAPKHLPALPASPLANLHFKTNSCHAKAVVKVVADSVILIVTPELGAPVRTLYSAFHHDTITSAIPAIPTPLGTDSTMTDTLTTTLSGNLDLEGILVGEDTLTTYLPYLSSYVIYTPATTPIVGLPGDAQQTITTEAHTALADGSDLYYIHVRAGNGATRVYDVRVTHTLASNDASLAEISLNGTPLSEFLPTTYIYNVVLPAHSTMPDVTTVPNDDMAVVAASGNNGNYSFQVTAEDGVTTQTYTLNVSIAPSDWSSLTNILVAGEPLADFNPATMTYNLTLPVGTTLLPEITYTLLESVETVAVDTALIADYQGQYTLTVTAEDGLHQSVYMLHFTVEKSTNALLASLLLDDQIVADFDDETFTYQVTLPFGTTVLPAVSYTLAEEKQTAALTVDGLTKATIVVTAEDGVTTQTYTVNFTMAKSTNASLTAIMADGVQLEGFDPADFEYAITLPYGTTELPVFTWTTGDGEQEVEMVANAEKTLVTITVTAGDGTSVNEYTIAISYELSANNYLADLLLNGTTIEGFRRDSADYTLIYPVGTDEAMLLTQAAITAVPEDADAVVTISEETDHTITIMVTAPNGDIRVYVISQSILLSDEARLKMIYLDEVALADFDSDVLEYTIIVRQGTTMPVVTAEALDSRAGVEYGDLTDEEGGSFIEIDGVAEDGTILTYTVHFQLANWVVTAEVDDDDFLFVPIKGTDTYLAVTISSDVRCGVYDLDGHLLKLEEVPVADPAFVKVETDEEGNQKLVEVYDGCNGMIFEVPNFGQPYCYVFYNVKTKRVGKGGKFMLIR